MTRTLDNETWVIEEGATVIEKKARCGLENLTPWERLVYSLWVADYGMRNAGDLITAKDVHADFQSMAIQSAEALTLPVTRAAFSLEPADLQAEYFDQFDAICEEIKNAKPRSAVN